jgi:hypothetical protein
MIDVRSIKFFKTKLAKRLLKIKIDKNLSLRRIFLRREIINEEIEEEIFTRLNGEIENFVTIILKGEQGSLKSSVGISMAKTLIDKDLKAKQISFLYDKFKEGISNSKGNKVHILDEQVFLHGVGTQRLIDEIQTLIETLRRDKDSMILISPEEKYFPEEIFTFVMETVDHCRLGTCKKSKELHETRTCPEKRHHIKKAFVRLAVKKGNTYIGFYIQEIDWESKIWKDYDLEKTKFLQLTKKQDFRKMDYEEIAKKIMKDAHADQFKTKIQLSLLINKYLPNITIAEKNMIAEQIKIIRGETK